MKLKGALKAIVIMLDRFLDCILSILSFYFCFKIKDREFAKMVLLLCILSVMGIIIIELMDHYFPETFSTLHTFLQQFRRN